MIITYLVEEKCSFLRTPLNFLLPNKISCVVVSLITLTHYKNQICFKVTCLAKGSFYQSSSFVQHDGTCFRDGRILSGLARYNDLAIKSKTTLIARL